MADWYVSSAAYAAIPVFAINTVYTVGQIIRPITTTQTTMWVFRCTTAGTSAATEPSWTNSPSGTTTSGTAVFTNVTAQAAYGWAAAGGNLYSITWQAAAIWLVPGDRVFLSSDHSESLANPAYLILGTNGAFGVISAISVNRAGAVPPTAADVLPGAAITVTAGTLLIDASSMTFYQGITFTLSSTGSPYYINFGNTYNKTHYFKDCAFVLGTANAGSRLTCNEPTKVIFDNTTVRFSHVSQGISITGYPLEWHWINTPAAI